MMPRAQLGTIYIIKNIFENGVTEYIYNQNYFVVNIVLTSEVPVRDNR